jgi:hypothetical protein
MEQRTGGDNVWVPLSGEDALTIATGAAGGTPVPALSGTTPGEGDDRASGDKNFTQFKALFMSGERPTVPKLEDRFKRSFQMLRKGGYVTIVVRVSWEELDLIVSSQKGQQRTIELRTVVADPYLPTSHLRTSPTSGTAADSPAEPRTTGTGTNSGTTPGSSQTRPVLPPAPRLGVTR